jgi:protein transport protein SEC24
MDVPNRPELSKGTVDFLVTDPAYRAPHPPPRISSFAPSSSTTITPASAPPTKNSFFSLPEPPQDIRRDPKPMNFVFAFDQSLDGVRSGFLRTAAEAALDVLYGPEACFPLESRIAFLTFDSTVHFYEFFVSIFFADVHVVAECDLS